TRYPPGDEYHRHVRRHVLGTAADGDAVVLGPDDLPDPTAWPSVDLSRDGRWLLVNLALGWRRPALRLRDRSTGRWPTTTEGVEAVTWLSLAEAGGRLLGVTTLAADRGRVVAVALDRPAPADWATLWAEPADPRRVIEWALPLAGGARMVRTTRWG